MPAATGIERGLRNSYTNPLYALLGIAALVLVIAGANLCALVFARAESRRQELAVRLALGSSRLRVIRELGAEGALLGVAGAIGGVVFAALASDAIFQLLVREYHGQHVARYLARRRCVDGRDRRQRRRRRGGHAGRGRGRDATLRPGAGRIANAWRDRREPDGSSSARKSPPRS